MEQTANPKLSFCVCGESHNALRVLFRLFAEYPAETREYPENLSVGQPGNAAARENR